MKKRLFIAAVCTAITGSLGIAQPAQAANSGGITSYCNSVLWSVQTSETQALWCQIQERPAAWFGYNGPTDGIPGPNTWKGVQGMLRAYYGYTGPIDGIPGPNTYKAMQRMAAETWIGRYTGPIDGIMGPNSWRGFANAVHTRFYGD